MTLVRLFLAHELTTQLRSSRFHGVVLAYVVVCSAPAVFLTWVSRRAAFAIGPQAFAAAMDGVQPFATTLLAAVLAVDAIVRERDEGSLGVVSLAPLSAAGYVLRRYVALVVLLAPITLLPRAIGAALAVHASGSARNLAPLALSWAVRVLPVLVVATALALALGTITGRTVLALIAGLGLFTIGLGITNDLLAFARRQLSGAGDLLLFDTMMVDSYIWALRGWGPPPMPTAAGFPLRAELERLVLFGAVPFAAAALFLGISCAYLRRTRPDLRPWHIRADHPLRSFLRTMNRIREEYKPDAGRELPDRIAIAFGVIVTVVTIALLFQRHDAFVARAAQRFAAEQNGPAPMSTSIVPASIAVRGRVQRDGSIATEATFVFRNDGDTPQHHLGFALNANVQIARVTSSRGTAKIERAWERVGVALAPPLAPRESRTIAFTLRGRPARYDFALPGGTTFRTRWQRFHRAKTAVDLSDMSRSRVVPSVSDVELALGGNELAPVPRYTEWKLAKESYRRDGNVPSFIPDEIRPHAPLRVELALPEEFVVADSCGGVGSGALASDCTFALADYVLAGARLTIAQLGDRVQLAHIPAHAELARTHGPSIAEAVELARDAWPGVTIGRTIFVERPSLPDASRDWYFEYITSSGALNLIPEPLFVRLRPLDRGRIAAALLVEALAQKRAVVTNEQPFFNELYRTLAAARTGGKKKNAVVRPFGGVPSKAPIVKAPEGRLVPVLADLEARVGSERLVQAVADFHAAGPRPGTARELVDAIARRGGVSLDRMWTDYFVGEALPKLTLADVKFEKRGDAWEVRGVLRNDGTGETFCPIVLRTAFGSVRHDVRIDSKQAVPFVLRSAHEPRTLQMDPDGVVYRDAPVGTVDSIDYRGER